MEIEILKLFGNGLNWMGVARKAHARSGAAIFMIIECVVLTGPRLLQFISDMGFTMVKLPI